MPLLWQGFPGRVAAVAAGSADMIQYFGFAINLAQKIAYLFGEDDLFSGESELNEGAKVRILAYLGAMFGASGAAAMVGSLPRKSARTWARRYPNRL